MKIAIDAIDAVGSALGDRGGCGVLDKGPLGSASPNGSPAEVLKKWSA